MRADFITSIANTIEDMPYKCILIDGPWGIGKTYELERAFRGNNYSCKISLFGLKDSQSIYQGILSSLVIKNNQTIENTVKILNKLSDTLEDLKKIKDAVGSILTEKEILKLYLEKSEKTYVVIFDDIERCSSDIKFEEILGIVEELRNYENIRIILVSNLVAIEENNKKIFEKYQEKIIDKIYKISDRSKYIDWDELGVEKRFIEHFAEIHDIKNLRTIKKAQDFFEDIKTNLDLDKEKYNIEFKKEIRLICFSIVTESIHNIYLREEEDTNDKLKMLEREFSNRLDTRIISNYLSGTYTSNEFFYMLLNYYIGEGEINRFSLESEYALYIEQGEKANYLKSDLEIKDLLEKFYIDTEDVKSLETLQNYADIYIFWAQIIGVDIADYIILYQRKFEELIKEGVTKGDKFLLDFCSNLNFDSEIMRKIFNEEMAKGKIYIVKFIINNLIKIIDEEDITSLAKELLQLYNNTTYRKYIKENLAVLYNKKFLPIGSITHKQFNYCKIIINLLYNINPSETKAFCEKAMQNCDSMSRYRIKLMLKGICE